MKAVDTNIVVRFLVNDDPKQCAIVKKMMVDVQDRGEKLWVSTGVLLETIWVLRSVYHASKDEIVLAVKTLLDMIIFEFQDEALLEQFCLTAPRSSLEPDDHLIGLSAREKCEFTWTFDKQAATSNLFKLLK